MTRTRDTITLATRIDQENGKPYVYSSKGGKFQLAYRGDIDALETPFVMRTINGKTNKGYVLTSTVPEVFKDFPSSDAILYAVWDSNLSPFITPNEYTVKSFFEVGPTQGSLLLRNKFESEQVRGYFLSNNRRPVLMTKGIGNDGRTRFPSVRKLLQKRAYQTEKSVSRHPIFVVIDAAKDLEERVLPTMQATGKTILRVEKRT